MAARNDATKCVPEPPQPVTGNVYRMSQRERSRQKIKSLPGNLGDRLTDQYLFHHWRTPLFLALSLIFVSCPYHDREALSSLHRN